MANLYQVSVVERITRWDKEIGDDVLVGFKYHPRLVNLDEVRDIRPPEKDNAYHQAVNAIIEFKGPAEYHDQVFVNEPFEAFAKLAALLPGTIDGQSSEAEWLNIRWICNTYDEFGHPVDPDCQLSPLAERVQGIVAELATKVNDLSKLETTVRAFFEAYPNADGSVMGSTHAAIEPYATLLRNIRAALPPKPEPETDHERK